VLCHDISCTELPFTALTSRLNFALQGPCLCRPRCRKPPRGAHARQENMRRCRPLLSPHRLLPKGKEKRVIQVAYANTTSYKDKVLCSHPWHDGRLGGDETILYALSWSTAGPYLGASSPANSRAPSPHRLDRMDNAPAALGVFVGPPPIPRPHQSNTPHCHLFPCPNSNTGNSKIVSGEPTLSI
jgi:hypothetical protein